MSTETDLLQLRIATLTVLVMLVLIALAVSLGLRRTAYKLIGDERIRRGRCPECAYDLRGNLSGICPECGTRAATMIVRY